MGWAAHHVKIAIIEKPTLTPIYPRGKTVNLTPGMAATVEIKTGKRKPIEFLLSPLMRMTQEAGRER